jgi:hypothetical protein
MRFDERVLNGMSVFAAIVAAGSFAAAGESLDMPQPRTRLVASSQQVSHKFFHVKA